MSDNNQIEKNENLQLTNQDNSLNKDLIQMLEEEPSVPMRTIREGFSLSESDLKTKDS